MKKILSTIGIVALLSSCKKTTTTPTTTTVAPTPTSNLKTVSVVITKGGVTHFTSIKWSYSPNIDSSYNTSGSSASYAFNNTTLSDSIYVYSSSHTAYQCNDIITIYVNGAFKQTYSGVGTFRKIYLNK